MITSPSSCLCRNPRPKKTASTMSTSTTSNHLPSPLWGTIITAPEPGGGKLVIANQNQGSLFAAAYDAAAPANFSRGIPDAFADKSFFEMLAQLNYVIGLDPDKPHLFPPVWTSSLSRIAHMQMRNTLTTSWF
jgi:hypothetical protein